MIWIWIAGGLAVLILLSIPLSLPITRREENWKKDSPQRIGLEFETVEFSSADGIQLAGWWIPAPGSSKTIVFLHGYHGSMDPDLQYAPWLHEAGYNLLMFDFRGHGRSGGQVTTLGALEIRDALAAVKLAKNRGATKIGLMGFSMGGRVAVLTAASSEDVDAIVCDCGPARISTAIALNLATRGVPAFLCTPFAWYLLLGVSLRSWINLFAHEPLEAAKSLKGKPSFFIQGARDPNIKIVETRVMVQNAGPNTEFWLVEDAGHRDISDLYPREYRERILGFFADALQA